MDAVKEEITKILNNLPPSLLSDICEHLSTTLGVQEVNDLKYVKEDDLPMLKPIQVRKIIENWREEPVNIEGSSASISTPCKVSVEKSSSDGIDWAYNYVLPLTNIPKKEKNAIERGHRPAPEGRRKIVRMVCEEIHKKCEKPGKKALSLVARNIVIAYPNSFEDIIEGTKIGTGYDALLKQLVLRFDNLNRKNHSAKRKNSYSDSSQPDISNVANKKQKLDEYGCINFMPVDISDGETADSLNIKKETLKDKFLLRDTKEVESLVEVTYIEQRRDIIEKNLSIGDLKEEWPHLFTSPGMFKHFALLTGIDIEQKLEKSLSDIKIKLLSWMGQQESKQIKDLVFNMVEARVHSNNKSPEGPAMVQAILHYFQEKEQYFYILVEPSATIEYCEKNLPPTPCLVAVGDSWLTSCRYMLGIDGVIVCDNIPTFLMGVGMLFAAYYNFNIRYPLEVAGILEFIQRYFVGINPDRGSKIEIKKKFKRYSGVHPRVLSLINLLVDVE